MRKEMLQMIALVLLILNLFLSPSSVQAAPGDILFEISKYHFQRPGGVAADGNGNVYVTDTDNNRIHKFDCSGNYLFGWGSYGSGNGQFSYPRSVAVDSSGNVYVPDSANHRIQKFDSRGNFLVAWGSYGTGNGQLSSPFKVAVDGNGNIYVADSNGIRKFDSSGNFLMTWGAGLTGWFAMDGSGNIYVNGNNRIQKFDSSGNFLVAWGSSGSGSVAVDGNGFVYVADTGNSRIQKFDSSGKFLIAWGSYGSDNGQFGYLFSVEVDGSGNVYAADTNNSRIQKFDTNGNFLTAWQSGGSDNGQFDLPRGVTVDRSGNVYVADYGNSRIQKFDNSGNFLMTWGSYGSGNGQFSGPMGVAVDGSGFVYVADKNNNRIQKFDNSGNFLVSWESSGAVGVAVDGSGNVYVPGNDEIQKFDNSGNFIVAWRTGGGDPGPYYYYSGPLGVAADISGNIYVVDSEIGGKSKVGRIQKFDSRGNFLASWSAGGGYNMGVAVDGSGNVYVTDSFWSRILTYDNNGNFLGSWGWAPYDAIANYGLAADSIGSRVYVANTKNNSIQAFVGFGVTHFALSAPPSSSSTDVLTFTVTALNANNNTATGYTGTIHFSSSDSAAVLPGDATLTNGVGTFTATLNTPGNQTITATDKGTASVTGTSSTVTVLPAPDLTVTSKHKGDFKQGQTDAIYTITVTNSGTGSTQGTVKVTDTLPNSLVATAIGGYGWACTLGTLTCTRSNALAAGSSYPPITVRLKVASDAPASVTNIVKVSGGGEVNTSNDTASDLTVITQVAAPISIWPSSATPQVVDDGADNPVELGVKFRSDVAGRITGIRFYKSPANTGTHVGHLWTSTGTLLATATFIGETASGWQQVKFSSPVPIKANTVYVASYHTNAGHYSDDQNYFADKGADNPPLHALAKGVSGFNGVYAYGSTSKFPNRDYNSSNYWVDVLFQP